MRNKMWNWSIVVWLSLFLGTGCGGREVEATIKEAASRVGGEILGPFTHAALTVFLITGKDLIDLNCKTLPEALEEGVAIVSEKEGGAEVNTLEIENRGDKPIYIQAGNIVKGGKQDRTLATDLVLAPRSGRVPIDAFCVEQGRWTPREGDDFPIVIGDSEFISAREFLPSHKLRAAAVEETDQGAVWAQVNEIQASLAARISEDVMDCDSPTSLQLTLESKALQSEVQKYIEALQGIIEKRDHVVGAAFSVGGKVASADVYGSSRLFRKVWPRLLRAAAVEALSSAGKESAEVCSADDVRRFLEDSHAGELRRSESHGDTLLRVHSADHASCLATLYKGRELHVGYISK